MTTQTQTPDLKKEEEIIIKNIYDNCLGKLQMGDMDTERFEDFKIVVKAFMDKSYDLGKLQAQKEVKKVLDGMIIECKRKGFLAERLIEAKKGLGIK